MGLFSQNDCSSKQAFCTLGYQTVQELVDANILTKSQITYTPPTQDSYIDNSSWVQLKNILSKIYKVGNYSNGRLPSYTQNDNTITPDSINDNDIAQNHTVDLSEYNIILGLLKQTQLSDNPFIQATQLSLQDIINNFQIENTRCNYCNTACDITCNTVQCDCNCNCNCDCNCVACSYCDAAFDSYNGSCGGCTYWDNS